MENLNAHLAACPSCRLELENEREWSHEFQESFCTATASQSLDPENARRARPENSIPSSVRLKTNYSSGGKIRLIRWLAAGFVAAILLAAVLLGPLRPGKRDSQLPGRGIADSSSLLSDDLPDPFSDWIEKRIIVTIEDKAKGTTEKFLSDRTGAIRKIAVPGRDQ
jgi:hypothetical protein